MSALHASRQGHGPPVALVHGFTQTLRSWQTIADRLVRAGHEVVAVDAPGHGGSGGVAAGLDDGAELLTRAVGRRASFVGYSMGGRLCLHLAVRRPAAVDRLILIGATAGIADPGERAARRRADEARADELEAVGDAGLAAFVDRWLAGPLFASLPPEQAGRADRLTNTASGLAASLRLAGTGSMTPLWDALPGLELPVLVVAGELDAKFMAEGQRLVAAIGPNARLEVIPGAGHAAHLEAPAAVAAAIVTFLA